MQQPAYFGPSSGADMLVDAYCVTDELDQADIPNMLMPSVSGCSKLTESEWIGAQAAGAKIRYLKCLTSGLLS